MRCTCHDGLNSGAVQQVTNMGRVRNVLRNTHPKAIGLYDGLSAIYRVLTRTPDRIRLVPHGSYDQIAGHHVVATQILTVGVTYVDSIFVTEISSADILKSDDANSFSGDIVLRLERRSERPIDG